MRSRRVAVACAIAGLVVLAGCGGFPGNDHTADPAQTSYPDGFGPEGITNGSVALDTHAGSLDTQYRISFTLVQSDDRGTARTRGTIETIPSEKRFLRVVNQTVGSSSHTVREFQDGPTVFIYRARGTEFDHTSRNREFERPIYADRETFREMLGSIRMNATTVTISNGTEQFRYTVTNVSTDRLHARTTDTEGTVIVTAEGTIRSMDITFTQTLAGIERETHFTYTVTTGANVTISRPSWVGSASDT